MASHNTINIDDVRTVFENAPRYFKARSLDVEIRRATVSAFAANLTYTNILDIGCGDGSISLPLLNGKTKLTLLDLSASMLQRAAMQMPGEEAPNVQLHHADFNSTSLACSAYDLIICVGVMAHVSSAEGVLAKIRTAMAPGAHLILEFTDSRHPIGSLNRAIGWVQERIAPARYQTNRLTYRTVAALLRQNDLEVCALYRYSTVPGAERILTQNVLARIVRGIYGRHPNNRFSQFGNEYLCLLRMK